jgi:toxin FitB
MIVLDTNVVSEPLKLRPDAAVIAWLDAQAPATLYITSIALAELYAGVAAMPAGKRRKALQDALGKSIAQLFEDRILSFDKQAAQTFALVSNAAQKAGKPMSFADTAIAAITAQRGFILATRNEVDFESAGIEVVNPWKPF